MVCQLAGDRRLRCRGAFGRTLASFWVRGSSWRRPIRRLVAYSVLAGLVTAWWGALVSRWQAHLVITGHALGAWRACPQVAPPCR